MERRLAAILYYDVVGYSRAMGEDESGTLERLKGHRREVIDPKAAQHGGRTIKLTGDGALMEFASVFDAVVFAVAVQHGLAKRNSALPERQRLLYRIGINVGDVIIDGNDIYGDGVNVAARLETLADPGGICIQRNVRNQVRGKLDLDFEDLGEVEVRNFDRKIRAFRIVMNEKVVALAAAPISARNIPRPRWQIFTAAVLALILIAGLVWWRPWSPAFKPVDPAEMTQVLPEKPSIAVLALNDNSTADDVGYLSDAISEGIITELSRFSEFFVIARNSSFKYRDEPTDVRTIAKELGVHYVLEGSQQKQGDRLRVTVQLIDALAGTHIWAETYDSELADLFAVQDEIVRSVASAVGGRIAFRPPPAGGLAAVSAMQYHLQGREHMRRFTPEDTQIALDLNRKAIATDPNSPFGYIGSAFAYMRASTYGWTDVPQDQALDLAREAADKALNLSPDNYDAHYTRAYVHLIAGEQAQAIARFREAIELNPSGANVMAALAEALIYQGQADEASGLLERAMRLDPHHPDWFKWNLAWAQWAAGECEAGLSTMQAMKSIPNMARRELANIYICLGRQDQAEATIAQFLEEEPGHTIGKVRASSESRYSDKQILERWLDGLRRAGLPE